MVAVVALGVICVAQGWALLRLVSRLMPPSASQYRQTPARPSERRTAPYRHPSNHDWANPLTQQDWPLQGDTDERP